MIDLNYFQPNSQNKPNHIILSVARLAQENGLFILVDACRLLVDWGYDYFECHIVGDGYLHNALLSAIRANRLERQVKLFPSGSLHELRERYHTAMIFALPCLDIEVQQPPLALVQAMATGLPIVSTEARIVKQVVVHNEDGLLVPSGNSEQLAGILAALLQDQQLRQRLGKAARQRVEQLFGG